MSSPLVSNKVVIVTGGASGIGRASVKEFVTEGASVVIADLDADAGSTLVKELEPTAGQRVSFFRTDVSKREDCEAVVAHTLHTFGHIDILFNNAGIQVRLFCLRYDPFHMSFFVS